jgi:hypothetical protein
MIDYSSAWVKICNRALSRLGCTIISAMDDGSNEAAYCTELLPEAVQAVLSAYDWNDAKKRAELAPLSAAPAFGFDYQFQLPSDYLRPIAIDAGEYPFSLEGQQILTDSDAVTIVYIARPADPANMAPYLQKAISLALALDLTTPLTKSDSMTSRIAALYQQAIVEGKRDDARGNYEGEPSTFYDEERS